MDDEIQTEGTAPETTVNDEICWKCVHHGLYHIVYGLFLFHQHSTRKCDECWWNENWTTEQIV